MTFIKDKLYVIIGFVLCFGFLIYAFGCQPKTKSLLDPTRKVTADELAGEIDLLLSRYDSRVIDIQKQQDVRNYILNQTLTIAQTGQINPLGIASGIAGLLGIGLAGDNVRLRRERKKFMTYEPIKPDGNV